MRVLLDLKFRDPQLNLALDEAILSEVAQGRVPPTLRIWQNPRCVVVGRGQDPEDEADVGYCRRHHIPVVRRASGGGAVYHYPGNLNFSLFLPLTGTWTNVHASRERITGLLAQTLHRRFSLPFEAREGSVFVGNQKVSGSAQLRDRALLHHGTLLLRPDVAPASRILKALQPGYSPKGVPSRAAPLGDLSTLTGENIDVDEGIRVLLVAFRPLGVPALAEVSLREWALAHSFVSHGA